jgi:hypothetical protein
MTYFPLPSKPVKPVLKGDESVHLACSRSLHHSYKKHRLIVSISSFVDLEGFEPSSEQLNLSHAKIFCTVVCQIEYMVNTTPQS